MKLSIAIALLFQFVSSEKVVETNPQECIDPADYAADTDFFPEKFVPHSTTDLITVTYHNTYKIITNKHHEKSYLLYQCGTEPPAAEVESGNHQLILSVPHTGKIAVTQTPQIPPMELLAKRSEIDAYIGNPKLVSSPCLGHLMNDESVKSIYYPDDPYNRTLLAEGTAAYLAENPDVIVLAGPTSDTDSERRMGVAASQERTAVATFDWIGMFAALFNAEGMANQIIADTESRYKCSAENAAALTADIQQDEKPKILWAQYFNGIGWSVASCPTWDAAYYCEYAQHCGAEIITRPEGVGFNQTYPPSPTVYWYLTDDEFLELGKDAETWIYPSKTFEALYNSKKEMLDQFKSVQMKNVYDTQGQGEYGWHEQRLAEYDVVALDMCTLVGTNNPDSIHQRRWFRSYYDEAVGSSGTCDVDGGEVEVAYVPAQADCVPLVMEDNSAAEGTVEDNTAAEEAVEDNSAAEETVDVKSSADGMGPRNGMQLGIALVSAIVAAIMV